MTTLSQASLINDALANPRVDKGSSLIALPDQFRLLTFNIQAGIGTSSYRDYVTGSWKHLAGSATGRDKLAGIAHLIKDYDMVALQEVDGGSLRSRQINQLQFLAEQANFTFQHQQLNRDFGRLGQFSNGLLSRFAPYHVENHRLPGPAGRGAIVSRYGDPADPLVLVAVHLALGKKIRTLQLDYLAWRLQAYRRVVIMGDFNATPFELAMSPLRRLGITPLDQCDFSYPSWSPGRRLDHILTTPAVTVKATNVLDCTLSDHLPIAMSISLT